MKNNELIYKESEKLLNQYKNLAIKHEYQSILNEKLQEFLPSIRSSAKNVLTF
jgi:hypothetical protein